MHQKHLMNIALAIIIVGLTTFYFTRPSKTDDTSTVKITGIIDSVEEKEKLTIIRVQPKTPLSIITFNKINAEKGKRAEITGKLHAYKGRVELLADTIKIKD